MKLFGNAIYKLRKIFILVLVFVKFYVYVIIEMDNTQENKQDTLNKELVKLLFHNQKFEKKSRIEILTINNHKNH